MEYLKEKEKELAKDMQTNEEKKIMAEIDRSEAEKSIAQAMILHMFGGAY